MSVATAPAVAEPPARNLALRIASATVLAPLAIGATYAGGTWFMALLGIAAVLMAAEWEALTGGRHVSFPTAVSAGVAIAAMSFIVKGHWGGAWFSVLLSAQLAALVANPGRRWWAALGAVYVGLPVIALFWLRRHPDLGLASVVWVFALVWATDIFAYVAGRAIGGPKLAPAISPGKTWAGLFGGVAAAAIAGWLVADWIGAGPHRLAFWSGAFAVLSQIGDLFESGVKRRFGVKDSGAIIPGHGGILDRVDGLIFAAVGVALLAIAGDNHPFGAVTP